jgi:hypothetical protein
MSGIIINNHTIYIMPTTIPLICNFCNRNFERLLKDFSSAKSKKLEKSFCSRACWIKYQTKKVEVSCCNCNILFLKKKKEIIKTKKNYCSKSCSATYHNKNKSKGTRRSNLEKWLEDELQTIFPNLGIIYNGKDAINSELDFFIPTLNLAFELNGIFHYEPIYGSKKLTEIQNNDNRKFQACLERGIELCIINTTEQKRFSKLSSKQYLDIMLNIINNKMAESIGPDPNAV